MILSHAVIESPFGDLFVGIDENGFLTRISFLNGRGPEHVIDELAAKGFDTVVDRHAVAPVIRELEAYFAKERTTFSVPIRPRGTEFQRAVWEQLCKIPYGACLTYGDIARTLGKPGASRAVGMANNKNPIPIVIPCHRVIGTRGKLVGFGGGTDHKHALLVHEGYYLL